MPQSPKNPTKNRPANGPRTCSGAKRTDGGENCGEFRGARRLAFPRPTPAKPVMRQGPSRSLLDSICSCFWMGSSAGTLGRLGRPRRSKNQHFSWRHFVERHGKPLWVGICRRFRPASLCGAAPQKVTPRRVRIEPGGNRHSVRMLQASVSVRRQGAWVDRGWGAFAVGELVDRCAENPGRILGGSRDWPGARVTAGSLIRVERLNTFS